MSNDVFDRMNITEKDRLRRLKNLKKEISHYEFKIQFDLSNEEWKTLIHYLTILQNQFKEN